MGTVVAEDVFQIPYVGYNKSNENDECTVREILSRYSVNRRHMASYLTFFYLQSRMLFIESQTNIMDIIVCSL